MKDDNIIIFTLPRRFTHRSPTTSRLHRVNFSIGGYPVPKFIPIYRELSGLRGASFMSDKVLLPVIPQPREVKLLSGSIKLDKNTKIKVLEAASQNEIFL